MSTTIDELLSEFSGELEQTVQRYSPFIQRAEEGGYPYIAKFFRAIVASETARGKLYHLGMSTHAGKAHDYSICPHCGLVFVPDAPDKCPVDDTLGAQFERIS
jgi:rubrerythrin